MWAVRWVAEDLCPFKMVADHGFLMITKSGCLGYYVPSPLTVSCNVKVVFIASRKCIAKMLQVSISFAHRGVFVILTGLS